MHTTTNTTTPTKKVDQLPRHDICRAYCLVAGSARAAAHVPLQLALRRALRQRLNLLKPPQLAAVAAGLAGLAQHAPPGRSDLLLADELARCGRAGVMGGVGCGFIC
jgi:hypothetical protein